MTMASHMDGINALPKWDRSNPTTYNYTPGNYNAADYAEFKQARLDAQNKRQAAAKARSKEVMKEVNQAIKDKLKEAQQGTQKAVSRDQVEAWAKAGHTLYAAIPSSCFEELKFVPDRDDPTTGEIVGTFWRGGSLTYSGSADLDEFIDAVSGGSLGEAYADAKWF